MSNALQNNAADQKILNIIKTDDGSFTLFHPVIGEHYHSTRGALQESKHVFLSAGLESFLNKYPKTNVSILEVGFGTGLNFLVSADHCKRQGIQLMYTGIERYPLPKTVITSLHYEVLIDSDLVHHFHSIYEKSFDSEIELTKNSTLKLAIGDVCSFQSPTRFDILYFDAFATTHQPEMWTLETLSHVCSFLKTGGIFVTYAITGNLKRILKSLDFQIEKIPGALGKREMLRAIKH